MLRLIQQPIRRRAAAVAGLLTVLSCGEQLQTDPESAGPAQLDVVIQARPTVSNPLIGGFTVPDGDIVIGGAEHPYTLTITNPGKTLKNVSIAARLLQSGAARDAGSELVTCPGQAPGVLPPGDCGLNPGASASNTSAGTGTLVPGSATLEVTLAQVNGRKQVVFDVETAAVTLVAGDNPGTLSIADLVMAGTEIVLEGLGTDYTVTLENSTSVTQENVVLQGEIFQGDAERGAGGVVARCPDLTGEVPPGTCVMQWHASASNSNGGSGTLVPGPATFVLSLIQGSVVLDSRSVPVTLVSNEPSIVSLVLDADEFVINGPAVGYTVTVRNSTTNDMTDVGVQATIEQGASSNPANGTSVNCVVTTPGLLLPGDCTFSFNADARTQFEPFTPGGATLILELRHGGVVVDSRSVPITLVTGS